MDSRFKQMHSSATFKKVRTEKQKVKLDDRFKQVLTDDRFRVAPGDGSDLRGRPVKSGSARNDSKVSGAHRELSEFYQIEEDNDVNPDERIRDENKKKKVLDKKGEDGAGGRINRGKSAGTRERKKMSEEERLEYLTLLARGEVAASSGSESESGSDDEDDEDDEGEEGREEPEQELESEVDSELEAVMEYDLLALRGQTRVRNATSKRAEGVAGESDGAAEEEEEVEEADIEARRIAVLNCDWQNVKAADLMVVLQSFSPSGGAVLRVTVYPSDFGLEQMQHEARYGPPKTIWAARSGDADSEDRSKREANGAKRGKESSKGRGKSESESNEKKARQDKGPRDGDSDENDEGDDDQEDEEESEEEGEAVGLDKLALREYELSKLRYYFAVAECDCADTAGQLYEALEGCEFEHSAMTLQLRLVPDDTSFEGRQVREKCSEVPPDYQPSDFVIQALQHTNVECSWDQGGDMSGRRVLGADKLALVGKAAGKGKKGREGAKGSTLSLWHTLRESEIQQYIASASSSSESESEVESESESEGEQEERVRRDKIAMKKVVRKDRDSRDSAGDRSKAKEAKALSERKKQAALAMRRKLLGLAEDEDDERVDSEEESGGEYGAGKRDGEEEDFFLTNDSEGEAEGDNSSDGRSDSDEDRVGDRGARRGGGKLMQRLKTLKRGARIGRDPSHTGAEDGEDERGQGEGEEEDDGGSREMTFMPKEDEAVTSSNPSETPLEAARRKVAERKKARKLQLAATIQEQREEQQQLLKAARALSREARKQRATAGAGGRGRAGSDEDSEVGEEEDCELTGNAGTVSAAELGGKQKKGRRKGKNKNKDQQGTSTADGKVAEAAVSVDLSDQRFARLLTGSDSRFSIDPTAPEFKKSAKQSQDGLQAILREQQRQRKIVAEMQQQQMEAAGPNRGAGSGKRRGDADASADHERTSFGGDREGRGREGRGDNEGRRCSNSEISSLVQKLKRKLGEGERDGVDREIKNGTGKEGKKSRRSP